MRWLALALVCTALPAFAQDDAPRARLSLVGVTWEFTGYVQVDATLFSQSSVDELDPSTRAPLNELAIGLRHAHAKVAASRWIFGASAEVDASTVDGPAVRLAAAEVSVRWPAIDPVPLAKLRLGQFRIPFGRDVREEPVKRAFLEPSTAAGALFPGSYDLGAELSGGWRFLRYQLAVMNGEPSSPLRDRNAAKDFIGRVAVVARPAEPVLLEVGMSGLTGTGFSPGKPATKDTLVWRDANEDGLVQTTELQVVGGLPATASANFDRFALGADASLGLDLVPGLFEARAEVFWAKNLDRGLFTSDPIATGRPLRQLGWSVSIVQRLPMGFAVGGRFDTYNPDLDSADQQGARRVPFDSSVTTWAAMGAWSWRGFARLIVQYAHQTNTLGRGITGMPTTLGSDRLEVRVEGTL